MLKIEKLFILPISCFFKCKISWAKLFLYFIICSNFWPNPWQILGFCCSTVEAECKKRRGQECDWIAFIAQSSSVAFLSERKFLAPCLSLRQHVPLQLEDIQCTAGHGHCWVHPWLNKHFQQPPNLFSLPASHELVLEDKGEVILLLGGNVICKRYL